MEGRARNDVISNESKHDLHFSDLNGKPLSYDPRVKIRQSNKSYQPKKLDYIAIQKQANMGITEYWGAREMQEDRVATGLLALDNLNHLGKNQYEAVLRETIQYLQSAVTQLDLGGEGSTLCATLLVGSDIYTAYVGDSSAFLCIVDKDEKVAINRLNTVIHRPSTQSEYDRIRKQGIHIEKGQGIGGPSLDKRLNVSRSLGDEAFKPYGLSSEPDFNFLRLEMPEGSKAFVVSVCDGVTDFLSHEKIADIIKDSHRLPVDKIAKRIASAAYESKSKDNISAVVTSFDPELSQVKYICMLDGHGGDNTSEAISHLFQSVLMIKMQCEIINQFIDHSIHDVELKNTLSDLLVHVDQAANALLTLFDLFIKQKNKQNSLYSLSAVDKNVLLLKHRLEKFVDLLNHFLHVCFSDKRSCHEMLPAYIENMNAFCSFFDAITYFEELHKKYCHDTDGYFLKFPPRLIADLLVQVKKADSENCVAINEKCQQRYQEMEVLYQLADIIFNVRLQYNKKLTSSYSYEFEYCDERKEIKVAIRNIESAIKYVFEHYPKKSLLDLVDHVLKQLENEISNIPATPYVNRFCKFFNSNDKLHVCLKHAINEVSSLHASLNKHLRNQAS
jgi:serine/threonine protein phosphatase PrpC